MTAFDRAWLILKMEPPEYQGHHQAPLDTDYYPPIFNLESMMPGIYANPHFYNATEEQMELLRRFRNEPAAEVQVFRSVPKGVQSELNPGDWVTPFREYAEEHGQRFTGGYDLIEDIVAAHDLLNEGNAIEEYGWLGHRNRLDDDVARWIRSHLMEDGQ